MAAKNARTLDWKEQRRWRALDLKRDGWTHHEIAEALDVTKGAVSQWITRVAREGEEALRARPHLGATPKLTKDQLRMIPEFLSHGAEAYGFRGEVWTCARIREVIRREFSVVYHKDHVSRLLKALRWTPQVPAERAAQRDEQKITAWREETWPGLKKKREVSGAPPSLLTNRAFTCCPAWSEPTRHAASPRCCAPIWRASTCR